MNDRQLDKIGRLHQLWQQAATLELELASELELDEKGCCSDGHNGTVFKVICCSRALAYPPVVESDMHSEVITRSCGHEEKVWYTELARDRLVNYWKENPCSVCQARAENS